MNDSGSLRDTWMSIFHRKGDDGTYTRLFDNLDPPQRKILLAAFKSKNTELPVIASVRDPGNWLVLTTERLAWSIAGKQQEVAINTISDATADLKRHQQGPQGKLEWQHLLVLTIDGREYEIELEQGAPLSGMWNVLKNLGARNRHKLPRGKC